MKFFNITATQIEAIEKFGFKNQCSRMAEELAELIQASLKVQRYGVNEKTLHNLIEEVAGSLITTQQILYHLDKNMGIDTKDALEIEIKNQLAKLQKEMKKEME